MYICRRNRSRSIYLSTEVDVDIVDKEDTPTEEDLSLDLSIYLEK